MKKEEQEFVEDDEILEMFYGKEQGKQIYTSYYARNGGHENAVSISASAPDYFKGKHIKMLAPTWEILDAYKSGEIDQLEYTKRYLKLLKQRGLTPETIYNSIPHGTILLCYEKVGDFCHRRVLAEWLELNLSVKIPEWKTEEERKKSATLDSFLKF